jgi:dihydropteroate synthase
LSFAEKLRERERPCIMGVLNSTPDSFSDGGQWFDPDQALRHAIAMAQAGADIIDIGGESTRPGSLPVSLAEEIARTVPLISSLKARLDIAVSIDTSKPEVMQAAVDAGAEMINDVLALQRPGALEMAARLDVTICLMHMHGTPRTMQTAPQYADVVSEVSSFLLDRVAACRAAGIADDAIVLDPGFGFGKTLAHNVELFRAIPRLCELGFPLLVGVSRKSMLGAITGRNVHERMPASVVAAAFAAQLGAAIVRVHDVGETRDALRMVAALSAR